METGIEAKVTAQLTHGAILGGMVATPDMDKALGDYRDCLGLTLVDDRAVTAEESASWLAPGISGQRMVTLQSQSGSECFLRLVEQPVPEEFRPTTSFGWAAYELTVQDVFGWPDRLVNSGFDIVGPPRTIPSLPYFVPMQVTGRGREMLYLNEVYEDTPTSDLPKANSPVDQIFIAILATDNLEFALDWYQKNLQLDLGESHEINYTMINKAFGLADGTQHRLTMVQAERLPIVEVDAYPAQAVVRPKQYGMLPPGNCLVTLAMHDLNRLDVDWIENPQIRTGPVYQGRRVGTTVGPAGELLELVEIK